MPISWGAVPFLLSGVCAMDRNPVDYVGRLPALGVVSDSLVERPTWAGILRLVGLVVALPWVGWHVAGWLALAWFDGLALVVLAEVVALVGLFFAVLDYRYQMRRVNLRLRRAATENQLFEQGYSTLFHAFEGQGVEGAPYLFNFDGMRSEVQSLGQRLDDMVAGVMDHLAQARPAVTVCPALDAPCQLEEAPPSILPLLDWPDPVPGYFGHILERFVQLVIENKPYAPGVLTGGSSPFCSSSEYQDILARLVPAGILYKDETRRVYRLAPELVSARSAWPAASPVERSAIEDKAHSWVVEQLALLPSPAVR